MRVGERKLFYLPVVLHIVALIWPDRGWETIKFSTTARYIRVYKNKTAGIQIVKVDLPPFYSHLTHPT